MKKIVVVISVCVLFFGLVASSSANVSHEERVKRWKTLLTVGKTVIHKNLTEGDEICVHIVVDAQKTSAKIIGILDALSRELKEGYNFTKIPVNHKDIDENPIYIDILQDNDDVKIIIGDGVKNLKKTFTNKNNIGDIVNDIILLLFGESL